MCFTSFSYYCNNRCVTFLANCCWFSFSFLHHWNNPLIFASLRFLLVLSVIWVCGLDAVAFTLQSSLFINQCVRILLKTKKKTNRKQTNKKTVWCTNVEAIYSISPSHAVTKIPYLFRGKKPFEQRKIHSLQGNRLFWKPSVIKSFYT